MNIFIIKTNSPKSISMSVSVSTVYIFSNIDFVPFVYRFIRALVWPYTINPMSLEKNRF